MQPFADKIALVTGASRGIGRAIATALAAQGATLYIGYKEQKMAAGYLAQLLNRTYACGALSLQIDIADAQRVETAWQDMEQSLGLPTILVNNAGIAQEQDFLQLTDDDWLHMFTTNLLGAVRCMRRALPAMTTQGWGRIVNIASIGGQIGGTNQVHYAAMKAGLIGCTKSLGRLYAKTGVTVNAVAPGLVPTDMTANELLSTVGQAKVQAIPLGRTARAEEVAQVVAFLCSPDASYVTGQTINVNGGMYCG